MAIWQGALLSASLEALTTYFDGLEVELSKLPIALVHGSVVGACSVLGGLFGGRYGLAIGGLIGHQINNYLIPTIRNVGNMLRELTTNQLQDLFNLLIIGIQTTVSNVQGQIVNRNIHLIDLLNRFGRNTEVRMNMIETLISFFNSIDSNHTYHQVNPQ